MRRAWAIGAVLPAAVVSLSCRQDQPKTAPVPASAPQTQAVATGGEQENDPLGANAGCYVCHMTFVQEELATTHLVQKVGCVQCHGPSAGHANDENVGATKPDIVYRREQINASCRTCHATHDVPPEKVLTRWHERSRFAYAATQPALGALCTDCHGEHRIAFAAATEKGPSK